LEKTEDKRYHSIAIPALCTGVFGYPAHKATKVIVEAIRDFLMPVYIQKEIRPLCYDHFARLAQLHEQSFYNSSSQENYKILNGSTTCIRQIYLCDVKNDSVDHFVAALERFYNKANVTKQRGRSNVPLKNKRHHGKIHSCIALL
jgi:hypothetical protein